jgi:hypothetical protein
VAPDGTILAPVGWDSAGDFKLDLAVLRPDAASWQVLEGDHSADDTGHYPAIALDRGGGFQIVYGDYTTGELKYLHGALGVGSSIVTAAAGPSVGKYNDILVDATGRVHVTYLDYGAGTMPAGGLLVSDPSATLGHLRLAKTCPP